MVWRPSQLTRAQMEERRFAAGRLLREGKCSQAAIAHELGVSEAAVTHWKQRLQRAGMRGLRRRRPSGRPSALSVAQWRQLLRLLSRGAIVAGFESERWTLRRIAALVERTFGVRYHFRSLGRALRARGWSPQQPRPRAIERDEALIDAWLAREWPRVKRGLGEAGAPLPSWTRRGTRFGPASARLGPPSAGHRSCGG
jgi:transposase